MRRMHFLKPSYYSIYFLYCQLLSAMAPAFFFTPKSPPEKPKIILTFFKKGVDKCNELCYNIVVPLMNVIRNCWCGSMAEHLICNQAVDGSTPFTSSNNGGFPERPKGADCKSVVTDFGGPNPPSPTKQKTTTSVVVFLLGEEGRTRPPTQEPGNLLHPAL